MAYEAVIYKYGASLYHKIGDGAMLRPNVAENGRYTFDLSHANKRIYYLYAASDDKEAPISPFFTSAKALDNWRMENNLEYGIDVYQNDCIYDKEWTGHR